jgi:hypothetical protein
VTESRKRALRRVDARAICSAETMEIHDTGAKQIVETVMLLMGLSSLMIRDILISHGIHDVADDHRPNVIE